MIDPPTVTIEAACRIRYRHTEVPAKITPLENGSVSIEFSSPQNGVTPGQAAVFYDGDRVIGGGWIQVHGTGNVVRGTR